MSQSSDHSSAQGPSSSSSPRHNKHHATRRETYTKEISRETEASHAKASQVRKNPWKAKIIEQCCEGYDHRFLRCLDTAQSLQSPSFSVILGRLPRASSNDTTSAVIRIISHVPVERKFLPDVIIELSYEESGRTGSIHASKSVGSKPSPYFHRHSRSASP